jgi:hypothetical protein
VGPIQSVAPRGLDQFLLRAGTIARVLLQLYYPLLECVFGGRSCCIESYSEVYLPFSIEMHATRL